jgi:hypothetical protein
MSAGATGEVSEDAGQAVIQSFTLVQRQTEAGTSTKARKGTVMVEPHCWEDYRGKPDKPFAALTSWKFGLDGDSRITVNLDKAKSWVQRSQVGDGETRNLEDAKIVKDCKTFFKRLTPNQTGRFSNSCVKS